MTQLASHRTKYFLPLFLCAFLLSGMMELSARSWQEIKKSGKLIVLTTDNMNKNEGLHRMVMPIDREQGLLRGFANHHGLRIEYVQAVTFQSLFEMLNSGKGDLISANLAETAARKKKYLLSVPFDYTREIVFTASNSKLKGGNEKCLSGTVGWVLPGTTYAENLRQTAARVKDLTVKELPVTIPHDKLITMVQAEKIPYSILNECDLDVWLAYQSGIRKLFSIRDKVPLVFAAKKDASELMKQLNQHLAEYGSKQNAEITDKQLSAALPKQVCDLAQIRERGYIRMITTNTVFACHMHRGRLCGFEYEMAKRFADSLKLKLVTVIPSDFKDLTKYLESGEGDFIAANFTMTEARKKAYPNFTFCFPYLSVTQTLAGRPNETLKSVNELKNRTIHVRKGNAYYDTLKQLQSEGIKFKIQFIPEDENALLSLYKVTTGEYDLTVVDDTYLQYAINADFKIKKLLELTGPESFSWVTNRNCPELAQAIKLFFQKENKSMFFNLCKKQYYGTSQLKKLKQALDANQLDEISPYDDLFRKYGKMYDFDWVLLVAQAYQESHFQPDLVNYIGATGLMQVMPETAKELEISDLTNPENGIHAGTKYMAKLRSRFSDDLNPVDKLCFTLASYNAGYGHVIDARNLAADMGLNPNVWLNNTEKAMARLEMPRYYKKAKYGFCRASETISYVQNIMHYAANYHKLRELQADKNKKL